MMAGAGGGGHHFVKQAQMRRGAVLVLADIEAQPLAESAALVGDVGVETLAVATDVSDAQSVAALADATIARFGAVHILCNNAGVGGGGLIKNQQLVDWKWVIDVNLWGVIHGLHYFLPHLCRAGEFSFYRLATIHNLRFLVRLMQQIREAIATDTLDELEQESEN